MFGVFQRHVRFMQVTRITLIPNFHYLSEFIFQKTLGLLIFSVFFLEFQVSVRFCYWYFLLRSQKQFSPESKLNFFKQFSPFNNSYEIVRNTFSSVYFKWFQGSRRSADGIDINKSSTCWMIPMGINSHKNRKHTS